MNCKETSISWVHQPSKNPAEKVKPLMATNIHQHTSRCTSTNENINAMSVHLYNYSKSTLDIIFVVAAYELWFKQILHELDSIRQMFTIDQLVQVWILLLIFNLISSSQMYYLYSCQSSFKISVPFCLLEF